MTGKLFFNSSFIIPHSSFLLRCPLPDLLVLFAVEFLLHVIAKRNLHERHDRLVVLMSALKLNQVVISTTRALWIFATDRRPRVIDRATARLRIEKLAGFAEDRIAFAPEHRLVLPHSRVTSLRHFIGDIEVPRQPFDVALRHLHAVVDRTTISRALRAVV